MKEPKNHFYLFLILILIGSSIPGDSVPSFVSLSWDKLLHVLEYSFLGFLGYRAFYKDLKFSFYYLIIFGLFFGIETLNSDIDVDALDDDVIDSFLKKDPEDRVVH